MKGIIDIHCHPPLKTYLYDNSKCAKNLQDNNKTSDEFDPFHLQTDLPKMRAADVQCIWAAHYVPESDLINQCNALKILASGLALFWKELINKVERTTPIGAVTYQAIDSIRIFERKIAEAKAVPAYANVTVPQNYADFKTAIDAGKTVIIHTLEGGHMLGRNLPKQSPNDASEYIKSLHLFKAKGVAMITLGHFFDNDLTACSQGLPSSIHKFMNKTYPPNNMNKGLTEIGKAVVKEMLNIGIIVDLIHCTPKAREDVYQINNARTTPRPLVFSHTGVQSVFNGQEYPDDKYTNPSDDEIRKIHDCGGVIGVILCNYWTKGKDEADFLGIIDIEPDPGIDYIVETIEHIRNVVKAYKGEAVACDNIAIGSDLDGFTDPPDDMQDASYLNRIPERLRRRGFSQTDIDKIMFGNATRVLENGWH